MRAMEPNLPSIRQGLDLCGNLDAATPEMASAWIGDFVHARPTIEQIAIVHSTAQSAICIRLASGRLSLTEQYNLPISSHGLDSPEASLLKSPQPLINL